MATFTTTIYEVPNSYVTSGTAPTISGTFTMTVTDDDAQLDAVSWLDSGAAQTVAVNGSAVDNYAFFYDDTIQIDGATQTVKTFQLTIDGTVHSYVMSDTGLAIPGAGTGVGFTLENYGNYTPLDYASVACFLKGTRLRCATGERRVEEIGIGDLVETLDHGLQPVRWIGATTLSRRDLIARPHLFPVRISAGALGGGLPHADLSVSPQHRVMVAGWNVEISFGFAEALAPARSLTRRAGVEVMSGADEATYYHLMFDRHEVVFSEGLPSESFLVGQTVRDELDSAQMAEIVELFPELETVDAPVVTCPARPLLKMREAAALY